MKTITQAVGKNSLPYIKKGQLLRFQTGVGDIRIIAIVKVVEEPDGESVHVQVERIIEVGRDSKSACKPGQIIFASPNDLYKDIELMLDDGGLFPGAQNTSISHITVQSGSGMIIAATTLFQKLGFSEDKDRRRKSMETGEVRWLVRPGSLAIRLIDPLEILRVYQIDSPISILVADAYVMADAIDRWLYFGGVRSEVRMAPDKRYFIDAPSVLNVPLELISG